MKFWKSLRAIVPNWVVIAVIVLCVSWASAITYLWVTTCSVDVTDGVKDVRTYSDALCTTEWVTEDINLEGNHAWVETVYVKNEGSANITVNMMAQGNTAFGFVLFVPSGNFTLAPQEIQPIEVSLYVMPDASVGRYNFSIIASE